MRNPYFRENETTEQDLIEDLTIETIKMMGMDMQYIKRSALNRDKLFGEDVTAKFKNSYPIETYIMNIDGFEGQGDLMTKFGLEIKDKMNVLVSRKRFMEEIGSIENMQRPEEGDLVFFPLGNSLFEITFVEHENPFYQLGKLYTYRLDCEMFTYNNEDFETGDTTIDSTESDRQNVINGTTYMMDAQSGETAGDSDTYEDLRNSNNIFDFTDIDPFSEGTY